MVSKEAQQQQNMKDKVLNDVRGAEGSTIAQKHSRGDDAADKVTQ